MENIILSLKLTFFVIILIASVIIPLFLGLVIISKSDYYCGIVSIIFKIIGFLTIISSIPISLYIGLILNNGGLL